MVLEVTGVNPAGGTSCKATLSCPERGQLMHGITELSEIRLLVKQRDEGAEKRGSRVVLPAGLRLRAVHRPNTNARQVKLTLAGIRIRLDAAVQS